MKHLLSAILIAFCCIQNLYAGWTDASLTFAGQLRQYRIYTPAGYDGTHAASLIVVLHGLGGSMHDVDNVGITNIADTANIILLAPQALDFNSPLGVIVAAWNSGIAVTIPGLGTIPVNASVDDVGFINAITDGAKASYNINEQRVYVCGASMGGFMTQRLVCEASGRFVAAASVMGTYALALPPCNPGKIVPVAHFHGTNDEVVSYGGALVYGGNTFPVGLSVDSLIAKWIVLDNCNTTPQHEAWPDTNGDGLYVDHFAYQDAKGNDLVELFKVNGGMHAWYQYSNTAGEFDYSVEIWKFFSKQYEHSLQVADLNRENDEMILYPNPVSKSLHLRFGEKVSHVEIADLYGRICYTHTVTREQEIDMSAWPSGFYVVTFLTAKGNRISRKITKQPAAE